MSFGAYPFGEPYFAQAPIGPAYVPSDISDADLLRHEEVDLYVAVPNDELYFRGPSDE